MNILLWASQAFLAAVFAFHGYLYLALPARFRSMMEGRPMPRTALLAIGVAEVAAAIGLLVPGLTGVLPGLVPLAAAGLVLVMVGAAVYHVREGEVPPTLVTLALGTLAAFVAYGRAVTLPL